MRKVFYALLGTIAAINTDSGIGVGYRFALGFGVVSHFSVRYCLDGEMSAAIELQEAGSGETNSSTSGLVSDVRVESRGALGENAIMLFQILFFRRQHENSGSPSSCGVDDSISGCTTHSITGDRTRQPEANCRKKGKEQEGTDERAVYG